jgi:hypothetical protein
MIVTQVQSVDLRRAERSIEGISASRVVNFKQTWTRSLDAGKVTTSHAAYTPTLSDQRSASSSSAASTMAKPSDSSRGCKISYIRSRVSLIPR